jgi:hypothetical protein
MKAEWLNDYAVTDEKGALHISIPLMLRRLGQPDTTENREALTKMVEEALKDKVAVIQVTD